MTVEFALRRSVRLMAYLALGGLGLLAGLVFGRPEAVALAAPFLLAVAVGTVWVRRPAVKIEAALSTSRVTEGQAVDLTLTINSLDGRPANLELLLVLPNHLTVVGEKATMVVRCPANQPVVVVRSIRCHRWGGYRLGELQLRSTSQLGMLSFQARIEPMLGVRVYPRPELLRTRLRPSETQVFAGNSLARNAGDGIEFADIRSYAPGDQVRRVNWRASSRRGMLAVNLQHLERNLDVILFLDAFGDVGSRGETTIDRSLQAAAGIADHFLARRDRVGLIGYGGTLRWLAPGMGVRQRYRIVETLLDTRIEPSYAWKSIDRIPSRILPPKALVIAITPLLDKRVIDALLQLRGRGLDLVICEVATRAEPAQSGDEPAALAERMWRLRRDAIRFRFASAGVALVTWPPATPLQGPIEEVNAFRRLAHRPA